jgi:glycosyltransferase involved in cell wall biosynthesis
MRILFFSHYFPPEGNAPASRTHENCKRWIRAGHHVTVITCAPNVPDGKIYEGYKNKLYQKEVIDGINVIRVWTYITANKGTIRRIINFLSYMFSAVFFCLFVKKPDVIIATSPQFFCGWAGVIASRMRRVPLVLEIRDIWPESIVVVGAMKNKKLLRILEWLEIKMYHAAERIVTVGQGYKQKLIEKGVSDELISVITNGYDSEIFYPRESDIEFRRMYKTNNEFICSYIGTIGMACGLEVVLEAAKILKVHRRNNIKFLLVGSGAVKEQLQRQAAEAKLDNVVFVDRQDKNVIPDFLSVTDACLVHLKKTELFKTVLPSKLFEAAAMAQPIILGVEGSAAQFVTDANAGICIEPENAEQLAQAVEYLSDNPYVCRSFGKSGYEYVTKYYNRDMLASKYIDMITHLRSPERQNVSV